MLLELFKAVFLAAFIVSFSHANDQSNNQSLSETTQEQEVPAEDLPKETAVFAMGAFWYGEAAFRQDDHSPLPGIYSIRVGFAGGTAPYPTLNNHPGYVESVQITFNPTIISYDQLLDVLWHNIDPLNPDGQFCNQGDSYKSVIFYKNDEQCNKAKASLTTLEKQWSRFFATKIIPYKNFYEAEESQQHYKEKNPIKYRYYRWKCGQDNRLKDLWGF